MSHLCCVDGCSKIKAGGASDESDFRCFIRWYKFPKNQSLQKKWIKRINRPPSDVNASSMFVCSDHFEDDDFVYRNLLQAELLSSKALAGHHIKLKDDAIPNTDRKTGRLRMGPPKAERALKRSQDIMTADTESKISPSRKRVCQKLSLKNVDDLIWENETIIGRLPSMSAVQRNIKLKNINKLISENEIKTGDVPSTRKVSRKFSLKNIDEIISENEAIIGDLQSMTKSTVSSLQVSEPGTGNTDETVTQPVNIKEELFESCQCYEDESASIAVPLSDETISQPLHVKEELVESFDADKSQNLSVNLSITQLMSEFESMIGDLPSTSTSTGIASSLPAYDSHLVSSANQSVKVKEEPLDFSFLDDSRNLSLKKIEELISGNRAVIGDLPSTSTAMVSSFSVSDTQDSQVMSHDTVPLKEEPLESNDPSNYAKNLNFIQNINKLISENEAIIGKLPDNSAELYFDFQHDSSSATSASSPECDSYVDETTMQSTIVKQEPMDPYHSNGIGHFSLRSIDELISENEAIVGGSSAPRVPNVAPSIPPSDNDEAPIQSVDVKNEPLESIHAHKDRQFGLSNIDELISENEAVVGNAMVLSRPTPSDTFPDETQCQSARSLVSSQVNKSLDIFSLLNKSLEICNTNVSSNLRNIDELISENEAIIGSLPPAGTVSSILPSDTATNVTAFCPSTDVMEKQLESSNHIDKKRNLSVGYIDELISENEAILGKLPSDELYHQKMNFATRE